MVVHGREDGGIKYILSRTDLFDRLDGRDTLRKWKKSTIIVSFGLESTREMWYHLIRCRVEEHSLGGGPKAIISGIL